MQMCDEEEECIEVDSDKMFMKLEENQVIKMFSTADLDKQESLNQSNMAKLANVSFLLKIICLHLMLVGFVHNPEVQLVMMILLEISYSAYHVMTYIKVVHFRSMRFIVPTILQSLVMLVILGAMALRGY
jgi:hypothetical protein